MSQNKIQSDTRSESKLPGLVPACVHKGFSLQDLSYDKRISLSHLYSIKNGINCPSIDVLGDLADALGTSTDYLLGRTAVIDPYPPAESEQNGRVA